MHRKLATWLAAQSWTRWKATVLELFVLNNIAFLTLDVFIAHAANSFRHWAEWVPVGFSLAGATALALALAVSRGDPRRSTLYWTGLSVGALSVLVGMSGFFLHLESQFFQQFTMRSLVYTAPFVAPLAFAGLGLLLLLNRMVASDERMWGAWVVMLALGGFVGNYVLAFFDHAMNGFHRWEEWIPVAASALAVGSLGVLLYRPGDRWLWRLAAAVMGLQVVVGLAGSWWHAQAAWAMAASPLTDRLLYGPPVFAPMLFADLAALAAIGLYDLAHQPAPVPGGAPAAAALAPRG